MTIKTIGQVLKEKRTSLGLGLSEAEQLTQVQKLYIVALETDDYKALPGDFYIKAYLKQYAEKLGLNADRIIQAYDEGKGITVEDKEDILETYHFVKPSERVEPEEEEPKTWRHYVPIISLSAAALLIVVGVFAAVIMNKPETLDLITNDYSYSKSVASTSKAATSATKPPESSTQASSSVLEPTIAITGSSSAMVATISNISDPVKVDFSAAAGRTIWIGMTNSNVAANGQTLTDGANTLSGLVTTGAENSVITLGSVQGLTLTVNGKALDLSSLTTTGPAKITLQINRTTTNSAAQ
ncbi:Transcriptional regulator in cluster with unspecified monosaccharide ABC transport system [Lactococcus cremoris]|nr:HTH domain-containing protein [Lactococcus cremoris subsp. cremoris HP]KZK14369.1 Transcriptional regulator in cluster with unspecified monosaccharide ABC transport system [Lactococcus cremoris]KZK43844.1 Transcriptional regulator in cluster with unspecified monosaccharide ABC transport system [Lactococcus cremoris]KZK48368.1 Transcriptional regulator in cluster with unspecified monosaccharide ABC transport system [Lactococcus cremoris]